jgi:hypothetical protein
MIANPFKRQPPPVRDLDDDDEAPLPFGVNRWLDLMAMHYWLIRQHRDLWEYLAWRERAYQRLSLLWAFMALLWLFIAIMQLWRS